LPAGRADFSLGTAASFAVLGYSGVTSIGNTVLNGNLGLSPCATLTGLGPGSVNGLTYVDDAVAEQAQSDALSTYNTVLSLTPEVNLTGHDLGGLTLTPGVYNFSSTAQLTGTLTLNAEGNPAAQFIFQIYGILSTACNSSVVLENGAQASGLNWQVGDWTTLGADTAFAGNILAGESITMDAGASLSGHAFSLNGEVILDDNSISIASAPEPNSCFSAILCAIGFGLGWGFIRERRQRLVTA